MIRSLSRSLVVLTIGFALVAAVAWHPGSSRGVTIPPATFDPAVVRPSGTDTAVLSGGCFWGLETVFEHTRGVIKVVAGFAGGTANTAQYETVSGGTTGHAESVQIVYDPSKVSYGQLLRVFFGVAHDPTQLNRQFPDEGTQYRSVIFYSDTLQHQVASAYIAQLTSAKVFPHPIVTQVVALPAFYPAEAYHQHYAELHPDNPYIAMYDAPKVDHLRQQLPTLYREVPPTSH